MAVIRENTFDGPDETAVTTANSGNHGDAFSTVDSPGVTYDTDEFYEGTASVRLDDASSSNGGAWQSLSLGDNAVRVYINRGTATSGNFIWNDDFGGISLGAGGDIDWTGTTLSGALPSNAWARVEFTRSGTSGTLSVWSTDPQSTGTPDATTTDTISSGTITQWWFEHQGDPIWLDAFAVGDDSTEIGPVSVEEAEATATTDPALASEESAGGFQTSVTVSGGVPDGRFCVVYGTANDFDEIVSVPAHWTLYRTDPLPSDRRTWVWFFTADSEPADYTVEWNGSHWHFLQLVTFYNVDEIRAGDGAVTLTNSTSLDAPVLQARNKEIHLLFGFSTLEEDKSWTPAGLTEINELPRSIIASYEHVEAGETTQYTLNVPTAGPLQATALLLTSFSGIRASGSVTVASRAVERRADGLASAIGEITAGKDAEDTGSGAATATGSVSAFKSYETFAEAGITAVGDVDSDVQGLATAEDTALADGFVSTAADHFTQVEGTATATGSVSVSKSTETDEVLGAISATGDVNAAQVRIIPDVPVLGLRARLVAYAPDGDRLGELPEPLGYQIGVPLNDMPSLQLEYSTEAVNAHLLDDPCEVAVEFAPLDRWDYIEPHNCRFLRLRKQNDSADRAGVVKYTMPHYGWMLSRACNINTEQLDENDERLFTSATPGFILRTLITEAQSRGALPGMGLSFTATQDSSGSSWQMALTIAFKAGQTLQSVMDALAEQGAFDWRFSGRTLQLYNPGTSMNRDRRTQVVLHQERDVQESPNDETLEELASRVFVAGDGVRTTEENPSTITPWGEWEESITQGGVEDEGTLTALAQRRLDEVEQPRIEMTRKIAFPSTRYLPFVDYRPGDLITAPGPDRSNGEYQVRQITINSADPHTVEGVLVLNDRFIEPWVRIRGKVHAILGGSGRVPGGSGQTPSPSEDNRQPAAPTGFLLATETFLNDLGEPRGQITASWVEVDSAVGGGEMRIDRYEVWVRRAAAGEIYSMYTVVDHPDTTAFMSPFEIGQLYQVKVRSVGANNRRGPFTSVLSITPDPDVVPPNVPSTPLVSTRLGVLKVEWDGLTESGTDMPIDFDHVRVEMSDNAASGFENVDTLYRAGISVVPDQPYDEERFFRLIAVDRSGNESDPSDVASAATSQLVSTDVSPGSIGYELLEEGAVRDDILSDDAVTERSIAAGAVTAEKIRAYSITADRIAVGNTRNLLSDPNLQNTDLNTVRIDLSTPGWQVESDTDGHNAAVLDRSQVADGTHRFFYAQTSTVDTLDDLDAGVQIDEDLGRVIARTFVTVSGLSSGSADITLFARFLDNDGQEILGSNLTSSLTFTGNATDAEIISSSGAAIPGTAMAYILYFRVILTGTPASTRVEFRRPFTATTNGQVLIEDGAVSANKIQANAITADKVEAGAIDAVHIAANAVQTTQLDADAINVKHTITGALIQTESSANRGLKITSTGMNAYDNNGNQVLDFSSFTGDLSIRGRYRSGLSTEQRVEIADDANYLNQAGLRMFSGSAGARDSSLFIDSGTGEGGWDAWSVVLTGSEVVRNSSGRTDLLLRHGSGGGGRLSGNHGTYANIGIEFQQWNTWIRGRVTDVTGSKDMFGWIRTGPHSSSVVTVDVTWGQAAENGGRIISVTPYARNVIGRHVQATARQQLQTGCNINTRNATGSFRLNVIFTWVNESVANS